MTTRLEDPEILARETVLLYGRGLECLIAPSSMFEEYGKFRILWAEQGDKISLEYAGTNALKGDLVRVANWNRESMGFKSLTAFFPKEESNSNVSVVITGVGPDFTKMESFGKVEEFADTLVSGLDRSWKKPPSVAAKLIDCNSSKALFSN